MFWRRRARAREAEQGGGDGPRFTFRAMPSEAELRRAAGTGSPQALNQYGVKLRIDGRLTEAVEVLTPAAEAGHQDATANLALTLLSLGRDEEAAAWFERNGPMGEAMARRIRERRDEDDGPGSAGRPAH
ncbi:tetratricopeptide repeat protein [Streptomyces sp. NPDC005732]|uniref:tetratricopeptide repeat protein n=1 Tax=Streptomyces sp. NPDC005732 TaxID=3157057 RepID=UPI0033C1191C